MARMDADKIGLIGSVSATISEIRGKFRARAISVLDFTGDRGENGEDFSADGADERG
jgi:hypothetical protein